MTVVATITCDDSRFDSFAGEQWFLGLPSSFWENWNELTIEPKGLSSCDNCGSLSLSYTGSIRDTSFSTACVECFTLKALTSMAGMDWRANWRNSSLEPLVPFIVLPEQSPDSLSIKLEECPRCTRNIVPEGVIISNLPSWSQRRYRGYLAKDINGSVVTVHETCMFTCDECGIKYVHGGANGITAASVNSTAVCEPCWTKLQEEDSWINCDSCDTYITEDNNYYSDIRDQNLCRSCYDSGIECEDCGYEYYENDGHECEEEEDTSSYIHSYGYKPRPVFYGKADYHLGLELEVEARNGDLSSGAEYVYGKIGDRAYLKYDGSLSNGFEIVTHPHSLHEMQNKFPWEILPWLQDEGFRSWNTSSCGIHVHVSRSAFKDDAHQIKFTKLIYDNQRQVERVAGRKSGYAKFNDKGRVIAKVKFGNQSDGRYSAVNNENENTLEVRVFRGSLRKERVLSAIEFTHAAVEYTRTIKMVAKDKPLSWARFIAFVVLNHQTYPNLLTIIGELFDKENEVIDQEEVDN